jgi:transcriptional regulator with XRE-family HTH domain
MRTKKPNLGIRLRQLRNRNGWTLEQVSKMTNLAISTLSKVERNQTSLTYDNLLKLAEGLGIDIAELFSPGVLAPAPGRRSITREPDIRRQETKNYDYFYHSTDLRGAWMVPIFVEVKAHSIEEFGELLHHDGEEFIYVLDGVIEVHTEYYNPIILQAGESVYLDSGMGHAYISVGEKNASILGVCSGQVTPLQEFR